MVKFSFRLAFLLTIVGVLLGCEKTLPVQEIPSHFILERYNDLGNLVCQGPIELNSRIYKAMARFINIERTGWQRSFVSYKTGPYILRSDELILRLYQNFVVVDIISDHSSASYRKNISDVFHKFDLLEINGCM
jgi:hypothetical protein